MHHRLKSFFSVNWLKTVYFNFSKFPFSTAVKLPVYFYGSVKLKSIKGEMVIEAPVKKGMIGFGQPYEIITRSKRTAEFFLEGKMIFKGHVQFGIDYFIHVAENAVVELGHMASLGNNGKLISFEKITLGKYARIGFESQIMDSSFHRMIDTRTNAKLPMTSPVMIGNYNYFGNRVSVMPDAVTPDYCTVASNSVCNNDYSGFGANILIGGVPCKLLKEYISRDWEGEAENMNKWLIA